MAQAFSQEGEVAVGHALRTTNNAIAISAPGRSAIPTTSLPAPPPVGDDEQESRSGVQLAVSDRPAVIEKDSRKIEIPCGCSEKRRMKVIPVNLRCREGAGRVTNTIS
jgi:hypothetical protein